MAGYVSSAGAGHGYNLTTYTLTTMTVSAQPQPCLVAIFGGREKATGISCTWHGVNMTYITRSQDSGTGWGWIELWYLLNPDIGNYNLVATWNAAVNTGSVHAILLKGINQASPITGSVSTRTPATTYSVSSSATDIVVDAVQSGGGGALSPTAGQTVVQNTAVDARTVSAYIAGNNPTRSLSWSGGAGAVAVSFKNTPPAGNQVIWMMSMLLDDLRKGLIPPWELKRRYRQVWAI